jgi:hypothetical protein
LRLQVGYYVLRGGLPDPGSGHGVAMGFRILGSFEVVGSARPVDLRGAKAAARRKSLDELIGELIVQPANAEGLTRSSIAWRPNGGSCLTE